MKNGTKISIVKFLLKHISLSLSLSIYIYIYIYIILEPTLTHIRILVESWMLELE